tara:strand:- start:267 stop:473 length:207 start_codon:yes stop_codon:yes gene_type:complete
MEYIIGESMVEYNWMTKEQKIQEAVSDLYWELDRMSTSGQETLNKLAKLVGVPDEEQMDKMVEDYYNV